MPNTLAHLAIQGAGSRTLIRDADLKWIFIGCIIPDLPWIIQRIAKMTLDVNLYDLRLYAVIQASLFFCLILSAALAALGQNPRRIFLILGLNSFFHLFLDALQVKWANGVQFLVPFNWKIVNWGLFQIESLTTYLITAAGLIYIFFYWKRSVRQPVVLNLTTPKHLFPAIGFLALYFLLPTVFLPQAENADNHFVKTSREVENRPGKYVEIDRARYIKGQTDTLKNFARDSFDPVGLSLPSSETVSIKGRFLDQHRLQILDYHVNHDLLRDSFSYVGLIMVLSIWVMAIIAGNVRFTPPEEENS